MLFKVDFRYLDERTSRCESLRPPGLTDSDMRKKKERGDDLFTIKDSEKATGQGKKTKQNASLFAYLRGLLTFSICSMYTRVPLKLLILCADTTATSSKDSDPPQQATNSH